MDECEARLRKVVHNLLCDDKRKIIARIINPHAFDENHQMRGRMREQQYALTRADDILAALKREIL